MSQAIINGAHAVIFSTDPDADRAFFRDVLEMVNTDVGSGWLVFGLPPAELAVHPSGKNGIHEIYLMCDDVDALIEHMDAHDIETTAIHEESWGLVTKITLPGGGKLGVYEPRHDRPG